MLTKKKKDNSGEMRKGLVANELGDKQKYCGHNIFTGSRFQSKISDKRFDFSSAPHDKGKPKPILKSKMDINAGQYYYRVGEEVQEDEEDEGNSELSAESGVNMGTDSKDYEECESSNTIDGDERMVMDTGDEEDVENVSVQIYNPTCRLAVVNLDWPNINADDLFALMKSTLRKSEQILSVDVYPSGFGIKCRQEEEEARGPKALAGAKNGVDNENKSDEIDHESSGAEIDDGNKGQYKKRKQRYYYAVVVCDSVPTAENLYKTLDGVLDLRFIEFTHPPNESAPGGHGTVVIASKYGRNRGIILASDTRVTYYNGEVGEGRKLYRMGGAGFGGAGDVKCYNAVRQGFGDFNGAELPIRQGARLLRDVCQGMLDVNLRRPRRFNRMVKCEFVLCGMQQLRPRIYHIFFDAGRFRSIKKNYVLLGYGVMNGVFDTGKSNVWKATKRSIIAAMTSFKQCGGSIDSILINRNGLDVTRNTISAVNALGLVRRRRSFVRRRRSFISKGSTKGLLSYYLARKASKKDKKLSK